MDDGICKPPYPLTLNFKVENPGLKHCVCSGGDHSGSEGRRALEKCARVEETPHFGEGETQERGNGWLLRDWYI